MILNDIYKPNLPTIIDLYHYTNIEFQSFNLDVLNFNIHNPIQSIGFWFTQVKEWGTKFVLDKPATQYYMWQISMHKDEIYQMGDIDIHNVCWTVATKTNIEMIRSNYQSKGFKGLMFKNPDIDHYLDYSPDQYVIWDSHVLSEAKLIEQTNILP